MTSQDIKKELCWLDEVASWYNPHYFESLMLPKATRQKRRNRLVKMFWILKQQEKAYGRNKT